MQRHTEGKQRAPSGGDTNDTEPRRNVEIKARIDDLAAVQADIEALAGPTVARLQQVDTFFVCPHGRLKLRTFSTGQGQLIYYERPDDRGAKTSHYRLCETDRPQDLCAILAAALGIRGTVTKERLLYLHGNTRIHLDRVWDLGAFLELEVVLGPLEDEHAGRSTAEALLTALKIERCRLVDRAYIDLLEKAASEPSPPAASVG